MPNAPLWIGASAALASVLLAWLVVRSVRVLWGRYRLRFVDGVSARLRRVHVFVDAGRLLGLNLFVSIALTAFALWLTGSLLAAAAAAAASGLVPGAVLAWLRQRRQERFRLQLSDLMMLTAGGLRAGLSLGQSLQQTAGEIPPPARQELQLLLREQRLGAPFDQALAGLERRMPIEEMTLLAAALRISRETGGNLAETLETLGDTLRRKVAIEGKIRALTAQGRLQGWAMGLLPAVVGVLLWFVEPVAMGALFSTWFGLATCGVIVLMQLLGLHFIRRVMRIDV
ncbi:MAG TPA: type II secretion system F family protein [Quisquiliibacterium sp.]|nr:type II secretion system F family protein [Quisquiliibacterium sp.]